MASAQLEAAVKLDCNAIATQMEVLLLGSSDNQNTKAFMENNDNNNFFETIRNYKEVISLALLIAAAFGIMYGYFATKNSVREVRCLATANITALNSKIDADNLLLLYNTNLDLQKQFKDKKHLDSSDKSRLSQLETTSIDLQQKISLANHIYSKARQQITSNQCFDEDELKTPKIESTE